MEVYLYNRFQNKEIIFDIKNYIINWKKMNIGPESVKLSLFIILLGI